LGVTVPDLYGTHITPPPTQDRPAQTAHSYARLRQRLRDAFPGVENDVDLERITERFMVELGWLQERIFPLDLTPRARRFQHTIYWSWRTTSTGEDWVSRKPDAALCALDRSLAGRDCNHELPRRLLL